MPKKSITERKCGRTVRATMLLFLLVNWNNMLHTNLYGGVSFETWDLESCQLTLFRLYRSEKVLSHNSHLMPRIDEPPPLDEPAPRDELPPVDGPEEEVPPPFLLWLGEFNRKLISVFFLSPILAQRVIDYAGTAVWRSILVHGILIGFYICKMKSHAKFM